MWVGIRPRSSGSVPQGEKSKTRTFTQIRKEDMEKKMHTALTHRVSERERENQANKPEEAARRNRMLLTVIEVHLIVIHTIENKKSDRLKKDIIFYHTYM